MGDAHTCPTCAHMCQGSTLDAFIFLCQPYFWTVRFLTEAGSCCFSWTFWPERSRDLPFSSSSVLNDRCAPPFSSFPFSSFVWVPGIRTRVLMRAQPGLYSLSQLCNPYFLCFDISISCAFIFPHRLHYSTDSSDSCLSLAVEDARLFLSRFSVPNFPCGTTWQMDFRLFSMPYVPKTFLKYIFESLCLFQLHFG